MKAAYPIIKLNGPTESRLPIQGGRPFAITFAETLDLMYHVNVALGQWLPVANDPEPLNPNAAPDSGSDEPPQFTTHWDDGTYMPNGDCIPMGGAHGAEEGASCQTDT